MDERDGELAAGDRQQRCGDHEARACEAARLRDQHEPRGDEAGEADDGPEVDREAPARGEPTQARRPAHLHGALEGVTAGVDQVVADVGAALAAGACEGHRGRGDGLLAERAAPGDRLDDVAVAIAGGEVHRGIYTGGIAAERALHDAHALDELPPVRGAEQAQAADAVADRYLVVGLALADEQEQVLDVVAALGEAMLEPGHRKHQGRAEALKSARQLGEEGVGERRVGLDHLGEHEHDPGRCAGGGLDHPLDPRSGGLAVAAAGRDAGDHAAQVLDQREAQHDGDRPQLAEA